MAHWKKNQEYNFGLPLEGTLKMPNFIDCIAITLKKPIIKFNWAEPLSKTNGFILKCSF